MFFIKSKLLFLCLCGTVLDIGFAQIAFDHANRKGFVNSHGYPFEEFTVQTSDGYILILDRIPFGKTSLPVANVTRPPVLLMPTTFGDSSSWILKGPEHGLPFLLAERGYDVWMGNNRGSFLSKNHSTLKVTDPKFWNFTFHELAVKDLPAIINFMMPKVAPRTTLTYIGHSMGATIFYILNSVTNEYASVFNTTIALAPTVYLSHTKSSLMFYAPYWKMIKGLASAFGVHEYFPYSKSLQNLAHNLCSNNSLVLPICYRRATSILGPFYQKEVDLPLILKSYPSGSSVNLKWQILQYMWIGKFAAFDYGAEKNKEYYNSTMPPLYNLTNVLPSSSVYCGTNDHVVTADDAGRLVSELPNNGFVYHITDYNHWDFLWGKNVGTFYKNMIDFIR